MQKHALTSLFLSVLLASAAYAISARSLSSDSTPSVDLKLNGSDVPITIIPGKSVTFSWTSQAVSSCVFNFTASSASMPHPSGSFNWGVSGSRNSGAFLRSQLGTYNYVLDCTGLNGQHVSDTGAITIATTLPKTPTTPNTTTTGKTPAVSISSPLPVYPSYCGAHDYTDGTNYSTCVGATYPYAPKSSLLDGASSTKDPLSRYQWNMRVLLEGSSYSSLFGNAPRDVIVAVLDTYPGHGNHPDLVDVYESGINLVEGGTDTSGTWDGINAASTNRHGQCAASIIAAEHNDTGMAGVFHRARILPIRTSIASLPQAINSAIARGAKVVHIAGYVNTPMEEFLLFPDYQESVTRPAFASPEERDANLPIFTAIRKAIEDATEQGIVVTIGVGNWDGRVTTNFISSRKQVISVGASNVLNELSPFNSTSYVYDLFAPGGDRRAASINVGLPSGLITAPALSDLDDVLCIVGPSGYSFLSGGSASAPHVAAAAAIIKSYRPSASVDEVRRLLIKSTKPATPNLSIVQSSGGILSLKLLAENLGTTQARASTSSNLGNAYTAFVKIFGWLGQIFF